jgi:hypothetical protein
VRYCAWTYQPLSPQEEVLCERLEKSEPVPSAAAFIRQQAHEINDLWDRLNRAYILPKAADAKPMSLWRWLRSTG